jgi:hypothetical protein
MFWCGGDTKRQWRKFIYLAAWRDDGRDGYRFSGFISIVHGDRQRFRMYFIGNGIPAGEPIAFPYDHSQFYVCMSG